MARQNPSGTAVLGTLGILGLIGVVGVIWIRHEFSEGWLDLDLDLSKDGKKKFQPSKQSKS